MTLGARTAVALVFGGVVSAGFARTASALEPGDTDFELGQQVSVFFNGTVTRNLTYATFHTKPIIARDDATGSSWELRLGARAFYDFQLSLAEVSIRDLALLRRTEHFTATLGFQQIAWGETLGFPVADIVNPRDLRDPLFLDVDFVRLPVLAANVQYTGGPFRAQAIVTPIPRAPLLPESGSPFLPTGAPSIVPLAPFPVDHAGKDAEGGGRVGYLVGGWDLSALVFSHWSRAPVYRLVTTDAAGDFALSPVISRVLTVGGSLTKPFGEHVLVRADSVVNFGQLQQSPLLANPAQVTESQSVVEGDLTFDGDWAFSLQYEYDRQGTLNRDWASARAEKGFFDRRLDFSVFAFKGINNGDAWIEPAVTWSFLEYFAAQVRADFVWGTVGDPGLLGYFDKKNRVFAILRMRF